MTDQEKFMEVATLAYEMGYDEALKRLRSSGSGAESCFSDAKRREQDGVEGRSRDGGRVSPGEAEALAALVWGWKAMAAHMRDDATEAAAFQDWTKLTRANAMAAVLEQCASDVAKRVRMPEPDSKIAKQASGRRNADVHGPRP